MRAFENLGGEYTVYSILSWIWFYLDRPVQLLISISLFGVSKLAELCFRTGGHRWSCFLDKKGLQMYTGIYIHTRTYVLLIPTDEQIIN
jgi:hypothetical protein